MEFWLVISWTTLELAWTDRSCKFALYNFRRIRPFLSEHARQLLLVQALVLSRLDYWNALLAGLPACSVKPLQLIQNATARVVFNKPKRAHVTLLLINLQWLPIAAHIKFKALMFGYRTTTGSTPLYPNSLFQTYVTLWYHPKEAQNYFHWPLPWLFPAGGLTCLTQPEHLQEKAKDTSCPSILDTLILILIILYLLKKHLATYIVLD